MELLVIILVLVYSVWSEVNKTKKEENVDIDFSELASLDDFFKDTGTQAAKTSSTQTSAPKKHQKQRHKKLANSSREAVNYDDLTSLTGKVNRDRESVTREKNYDELSQLTGRVNYERTESCTESKPGDELSEEDKKMFAMGQSTPQQTQPQAKPIQISFDRDSVIKAFVMAEVLQRYDLERIYSRIPGINNQED